MKQCLAVIACSVALCAAAQTSPVPAPEDWRAESFIFPLQFAPSIPYQGVEYVRFSPTWQRFEAEGGFSYVILWDVKTVPVTPEDLEDYLEVYFAGLMKNVGLRRELSDKEMKTAAAVHPMAALPNWEQGYGIEVHTWNAFSKGEALLLQGEVGQRTCGERMQVFFAFSQSPRSRPIWDRLREIRNATTCR